MPIPKRNDTSEPEPFTVKLVEKSDPPAGASGADWYRYVVESSRSTITGYSHGSRAEVSRHAQTFVDELNARASGRARSPWTRRSKA
ncbi:MAG: hypothetical protein PVI15_07165 [Chromatiales bacterium]|jgi:hypothetical protein